MALTPKEREQRYRAKHRDELKQRRVDNRRLVLDHYGGMCACCGETRTGFLAIDHINGGGRKHRKEIHCNTVPWLIANGFPSGFRVLCHNCNMARGLYVTCPHETELTQQRDAFVAALGVA